MSYSVTLEHGSDGSYLAWVHELPGCFARAKTRDAVLANVADEIARFRDWLRQIGESQDEGSITIAVADEVESVVETNEDTEVLLAPDRAALSEEHWETVERWLGHSRTALVAALRGLAHEQLEEQAPGRERSVRDQAIHIAFVELMYAAWTFDLRSQQGLIEFLGWTRGVASERMRELARFESATLTYAEWAGALRAEPWTARKAARRLLWHELLHLPEIER